MARDYRQGQKRRRSSGSRKKSQGISRGTAFGVGICVGAIATALVFVNGAKLSVDDLAHRLAGDDGDPVVAATKYEFYTVLPDKEMAVPDPPAPAEKPAPAASAASSEKPRPASDGKRYTVQAGSFKKAADAESLKARLALLGLQARVQSVSLGNQGTWHRVQLGPFDGRASADEVTSLLTKNKLKSMTMQLK